MRKIRKFKVAIHLKEILRRIRLANIDTAAAGFSLESDLAVFISALHSALAPGVVYEFIEGQCLELSTAGIKHNDMFSICVITLGQKIELEAAKSANMQAMAIANIVLYEFLRTATTFVSDLIKEDAQKEDFTVDGYEILSSPVFGYIPEPKFLREAARVEPETARKVLPVLFDRLNAEKINVKFEDGKVEPKATIAFMMPWHKKKGKK
ncbi:MAG: hypothetical protein LBM71_03740 [Elusimicrobiota bacterium]|jgi:hypothetical protein|nr:hypothetical protein [Elusimicrobiota bacterium]